MRALFAPCCPREKRLRKQLIAAVSVVIALIGCTEAVRAEIYAYVTPKGDRLYTDQVMLDSGYRPANAAARTAKRHRPKSVSTAAKARIDGLIDRWAPSYALDPRLVKAVVDAESGYQVNARSRRNAQGLMQLIPETATRFGVHDPWNPEQNLRGGMAYLSWLMGEFRGSVPLVLAAYNAGENAVIKYGGIPPYNETQNYVRKIRRQYPKRSHPYVRIADNRI